MELYRKMLKRSYPNADVGLSEGWMYCAESDTNFEVYFLWVRGKVIKKFMTFKDMVKAISFLCQSDQTLVEV